MGTSLARRQRREAHQEVVSHPPHYTDRVPGIECIAVAQHFNFCVGNAIKYLWRAGLKGDAVTDLQKARQYIDFEIARLSADAVAPKETT